MSLVPTLQKEQTIKVQALNAMTFPLFGMRLIEASAGTGKTYTIASLFIRLLLGHGDKFAHRTPLAVDQILVVTFTEAATGELRSRIRERIVEVRLACLKGESGDPFISGLLLEIDDLERATRLLRFAELQMDEAAIYTIHGFCQRMLKQNAFESGSLFQQALIEDESDLLQQACNDFWRIHFYSQSTDLTAEIFSYWQSPQALMADLRAWLSRKDCEFLPTITDFDFEKKYTESLENIEKLKEMWLKDEDDYFDIITHSGVSKRSYTKKNLPNWLNQISEWASQSSNSLALHDKLEKFSQAVLEEKTAKGGVPTHAVFVFIEKLLSEDLSIKNLLLIKATTWVRENCQKNKQLQMVLGFDDLIANLGKALANSDGNRLGKQIRANYPIALIDEFQDTDPTQYDIFQTIYKVEDDLIDERSSGLFMIGDPKQAIYSFRGADIFTYMKARKNVSAHYSLDYNYRSSKEMIEAVNAFFEHCPDPFIYEDIPFISVKAPNINRKKLVTANFDDENQTALQFIRSSAGVNTGDFKQIMADAVVSEIKTLLLLAQQNKAYLEDKKGGRTALRANNIAVLVRTGKEAKLIRDALFDENIKSVYLSLKESVYDSPLAQDLLLILTACLSPDDDRLLRAAVACKLFCLSLSEIDTLFSDTALWEKKIAQFTEYKALWNKSGVLGMLQEIFHQEGISQAFLAKPQGERQLTDLLHLAELLQKNSVEFEGEFALLRWFGEQILQAKEGQGEQKQRLESERDLVQVSTLHKSKGLEYDIVFMPFTGIYAKPRSCLYHDPKQDDRLFYDLNKEKEHFELTEKEQLAEDLRLLYVGITRSVYRCYIGIGPYKSGNAKKSPLPKSALGHIVFKGLAELLAGDSEAIDDRLNMMGGNCNSISIRELPERDEAPYQALVSDEALTAPRRFKGNIERNWLISSYSSLSRFHTSSPVIATKVIEPDRSDVKEVDHRKTPFNFPRGAKHGTFLHELFEYPKFFEDIDFTSNEDCTQWLQEQLEKRFYDDSEAWSPVLAKWIEQILDHQLLPSLPSLKLNQLSAQQMNIEMRFFIDMQPLHDRQVNKLIKQYDSLSANAGELQFQAVQGVLKGFIDLIFEFEGKYYVLDYKSNHLGDNLTDYNAQNIEAAMIDHRYDFQYQLYTLALHRLLKSRLPDYDYEKHIGGVFYTFLRGMQGEKDHGVYFTKPKFELIDGLDKLFQGGQEYGVTHAK
jgi:exodeoxyribonuclease V beta subunit